MANAIWREPAGNFEEQVVTVWGSFVIGASGAVLTVKGGGVLSVVKQATAGQYTITLNQQYSRLLWAECGAFSGSLMSFEHGAQLLANPATLQASFASVPALTFQFTDFNGAAANPPSGSVATFKIDLRNSSVGPWD